MDTFPPYGWQGISWTSKTRQLQQVYGLLGHIASSERYQLSDQLGFLPRGRLLLCDVPVRSLAKRGRERTEQRSTATRGTSKSIAVDGAGAEGSAEGRWRLMYLTFVRRIQLNSASRL